MPAAFTALIFAVDVVVVGVVAWWLAQALQPGARGRLLESTLAWLIATLVLVAGCAVALGLVGWLNSFAQLTAHGAVGLALWTRRTGPLSAAAMNLPEFFHAWRRVLREHPERGFVWTALALFLVVGAISACATPLVFDSLTYRLPRVASWLQSGSIAHLSSDDVRLNYMPVGPDLILAWLLGATRGGFWLTGLAQLGGGALLAGATVFFGAWCGLSRRASIGAAALVFGFPNVAAQLGSMHTDLFTAGVFAASAALWLGALERQRGSWLAGLGLALALGSKGTVFYLLPGAAVLAAGALWRTRARWTAQAPTALALLLGVAIFCGPLWWRNQRAYGHFTGPEKALLDHYGPARPLAQRLEKLALNLHAAAAQACDPHSQPPWLRAPIERVGRELISSLPKQDAYTFESVDRPQTLRLYFDEPEPSSDFIAPGAAVLVNFVLAGVVALLLPRRDGAWAIVVCVAGVGIYWLVQNAVIEWHPWAFRYAVLVAPGLALAIAWLLTQLPRALRLAAWTFFLAGAAWGFGTTFVQASHTAWRGFEFTWQAQRGDWRDWAAALEPRGSALHVALPVNSPTSQFFRGDEDRPVKLAALSQLPDRTAEEVVAAEPGSWLVVPAMRFLGREGRVVMKAWILRGDPRHRLSLLAFRTAQPGETLAPSIYADLGEDLAGGFARVLVFRAWENSSTLLVRNPSASRWNFELTGSGNRVVGSLAPGSTGRIPLNCSAETATQVRVEFTLPNGTAADGRVPFVQGIERRD